MRNLLNVKLVTILGASVMLLAGCGGGGSDGDSAAASTAQGAYGGVLTGSASSEFQMLVLENDEFWALYGRQTATQFLVAGFLQGNGASKDGSFTASNVRDFGFFPALAGTASATYDSSKKTISGTVSAAAGNVGFSGGPIAGSPYDYSVAAQISNISGAWNLTGLTGEKVTLNVASNGGFSAFTSTGCAFSGTIGPRSSGKNVFSVSLTFGAAPCGLAGQDATGIAVAYPLSTGQTQLLVAVHDSARTAGSAAFGVR